MSRKPIGDVAMTATQRQRRRRDKLRALRPVPLPDLLTLDPEAIAARIFAAVPPEKVDRIVAALNQRLVRGRGTFGPRNLHVAGGALRR
jgi:hypothetical protein